ncbi:uncharacterized protein LOC134539039 [Bacillus rossius redtenbacheri]|uniref:uncharacterized protein LOC134539039 n=1 Tax=Bacillus rossius redtenbacheri TaxID=93214 RepID=UPI002FDE6F9F
MELGAKDRLEFGTSYRALSGMACIIGARSRKVLFASTRNSYCCICARSSTKNEPSHEHICYKNWLKTPTAMEADIIVEGFKNSMSMHNLKYGYIIGDGDSSVMAQLTKAQPYGPEFTITKIECSNHILRNYLRRIRDISTKTKNPVWQVPLSARRAITVDRQLRLRSAVTSAMKYRAGQADLTLQQKINELKKDIQNGPFHAFGDHSMCQERGYFCTGPKQDEDNIVPDLKVVGIWDEILAARNIVASHAASLIHNVSTNRAESFNSIICKYVSGKRVNHCLRGGYNIRCDLSVINVNSDGRTQGIIHKSLTRHSPGKICKQNILSKQNSVSKRRKRQRYTL